MNQPRPSPAAAASADGPASREPVVELRGVTRLFAGTAAVNNVSLNLYPGEFFSLLGPSGCGKTTTLRIIAGFERPDSGEVLVAGTDVKSKPPNRRPVNTVFQNYALFTHLTVAENIEFGLRERRVPRSERRVAVREALGIVRLEGYDARSPSQLSGGEQQRVALARAIVNRPTLLLLDEPLGALDLKLRRAMQEELQGIQRQLGMTFLYVTHDQEEALLMSDRIGVMRRGRLEQVGRAEEIYDRPASAYVADFIGEANILAGRVQERAVDHVQIQLDCGQVVAASCEHPLEVGTRGALVLRPERVSLAQETPKASAARLAGTITGAFFVGNHRRINVDIGNETRIVVQVPSAIDAVLEPGASVALEFESAVAWFLPDETPLTDDDSEGVA